MRVRLAKTLERREVHRLARSCMNQGDEQWHFAICLHSSFLPYGHACLLDFSVPIPPWARAANWHEATGMSFYHNLNAFLTSPASSTQFTDQEAKDPSGQTTASPTSSPLCHPSTSDTLFSSGLQSLLYLSTPHIHQLHISLFPSSISPTRNLHLKSQCLPGEE